MLFLSLFLLLSAGMETSATGAEPTVSKTRPTGDSPLLETRLESARLRFSLLGVAPPAKLDANHVGQIREKIRQMETLLVAGSPEGFGKQPSQGGGDTSTDRFDLVARLMPPAAEKFLSSLDFTFEVVENPNLAERVENPQDRLRKFTLTLDFASLFPSSSELRRVYGQVSGFETLTGQEVRDPLVGLEDKDAIFDYFSRKRKGDYWMRILSGFSVSASISERLDPASTISDEIVETWAFLFNPDRLIASADKVDAYSAYIEYAKAFPERFDGTSPYSWQPDQRPYCKTYDECKKYAQPTLGERVFKLLTPTIAFERLDQFERITGGGDVATKATLDIWLFNWDLSPLFESSRVRIATLELMKKQKELEDFRKAHQAKSAGGMLACPGLDATCADRTGSDSWTNGAPEASLDNVRMAAQNLLGDYLDICIRPEVLLDERWVAAFNQRWSLLLGARERVASCAGLPLTAECMRSH
ncbi:MAG TPA: hypothetical protein VLV83_03565 [Acidobacteriota bacterium]|nr:hypothetical protein [Acidobacteriota bacterium]